MTYLRTVWCAAVAQTLNEQQQQHGVQSWLSDNPNVAPHAVTSHQLEWDERQVGEGAVAAALAEAAVLRKGLAAAGMTNSVQGMHSSSQ